MVWALIEFEIYVSIKKNPEVLISETVSVGKSREIYKTGDCIMVIRNNVMAIPDTTPPFTTLHEGTMPKLDFGEIGIILSSYGDGATSVFYLVLFQEQRTFGVFGDFIEKVNDSNDIDRLKKRGPRVKSKY